MAIQYGFSSCTDGYLFEVWSTGTNGVPVGITIGQVFYVVQADPITPYSGCATCVNVVGFSDPVPIFTSGLTMVYYPTCNECLLDPDNIITIETPTPTPTATQTPKPTLSSTVTPTLTRTFTPTPTRTLTPTPTVTPSSRPIIDSCYIATFNANNVILFDPETFTFLTSPNPWFTSLGQNITKNNIKLWSINTSNTLIEYDITVYPPTSTIVTLDPTIILLQICSSPTTNQLFIANGFGSKNEIQTISLTTGTILSTVGTLPPGYEFPNVNTYFGLYYDPVENVFYLNVVQTGQPYIDAIFVKYSPVSQTFLAQSSPPNPDQIINGLFVHNNTFYVTTYPTTMGGDSSIYSIVENSGSFTFTQVLDIINELGSPTKTIFSQWINTRCTERSILPSLTPSVTPTITPSKTTNFIPPTPSVTKSPTPTRTPFPSNITGSTYTRITGVNECDVVTLIPMGVWCESTPNDGDDYEIDDDALFNNTIVVGSNPPNGTITIYISGGTPPYTIETLSGLEVSQYLTGLVSGIYTFIVRDFYNDFVITLECEVLKLTPTPTQTPTITPTPTVTSTPNKSPTPTLTRNLTPTPTPSPQTVLDFCLRIVFSPQGSIPDISIHFIPSSPGVWNAGTTGYSGWTVKYYLGAWYVLDATSSINLTLPNVSVPVIVSSSSPQSVGTPLSNWALYGNIPRVTATVSTVIGKCPTVNPNVDTIEFETGANDPSCGCDGNIYFTITSGTTPPYYFTIDGGQTWEPSPTGTTNSFYVFRNLCEGTYSVGVKDSQSPPQIIISRSSSNGVISSSSVWNLISVRNGSTSYSFDINFTETTLFNNNISNTSRPRYKKQVRYDFTISIIPQLEPGESITFDFSVRNNSLVRPYIIDSQLLGRDGQYKMGVSGIQNLNVEKNGITITPSIPPQNQIIDYASCSTPYINGSCLDQFSLIAFDRNVLTSVCATGLPEVPFQYGTYHSAQTTTYNIVYVSGDIITGSFIGEVIEDVWPTQNTTFTTPDGQVYPHNFLSCEVLKNISTVEILGDIKETLLPCNVLSLPEPKTRTVDIFCLRNPNSPSCFAFTE